MQASSVPLVAEALAQIARDGHDAWAFVATSAADGPAVDGPLRGIPFGVKDIIDVARMPTGLGLRQEARRARFDAWCVAALRAAGAVPVGKTRTTAHAYRDPASTRNPLDSSRTPGGSSAGSAAAVGAHSVPFALGTQTIGSILRPAAYCGVVGFKPTWGRIPVNGVAPFAPSLDHVGVIARDVGVARDVARVLIPALGEGSAAPLRIGIAASLDDDRRSPAAHAATRAALDRLAAAGLTLERRTLPLGVETAPADADVVCAFEAHAVLAPLLGAALPPELHGLLERGRSVDRDRYLATLAGRDAAFAALDAALSGVTATIVPAGDAAPPPDSTGNGGPYAAWSYFGMPAITIPIPGTAPAAVGLQLVAARGHDAELLACALRVEAALRGAV